MIQPKYIRIGKINEVYGLSRWTIYRLCKEGKLTINKVGRAAMIEIEELEKLIEPAP